MHSGSNNVPYGGFVSHAGRQPVSLPEILGRYVSKGYAVWKLPPTEAVESLVNGNHLEWLRTGGKCPVMFDLDTILATQPPAAALRSGYEYIALPPGWTSANGGSGNSTVVQCSRIRVSVSHFIIGNESIFALNVRTQMPAKLTISDFYNALDGLKPVTQELVREKRER